jgi:uncharacterized protein with GYD domain
MATYIILSKLSAEATRDPAEFRQIAEKVSAKIKTQCPKVRWVGSYALMGRFDVIDIVDADDPTDVEKAAMVIRYYGHAATETMQATPWHDFLARL